MAEMGHKPQLEPPWSLPHVRSASNSYHKIVQRSVRSRAEAEGADHRAPFIMKSLPVEHLPAR